ncbi:MAG: 16S rRNA (uracil(1498)-N(3))-methyltransferase, partial [Methylothermaceae bacterium]|nr:16S rRNA (uracil(1498)-N(3))-methyltransferase [Methylothermaceae bacterium]
ERRRAQDRGFVPARLGPRILRVETAVAAALSAAQVLWGDGGG